MSSEEQPGLSVSEENTVCLEKDTEAGRPCLRATGSSLCNSLSASSRTLLETAEDGIIMYLFVCLGKLGYFRVGLIKTYES